jgi:ATP-dependent protease HslVU (ClpYQ) peptidase subunit
MTTVVAVRRRGRTCVVADSLTTYGARRKESYETLAVPSSKLFVIENLVIGTSGDAAWGLVVRNFLAHRQQGQTLSTPRKIVEALFDLFCSCKDTYFIDSKRREPFSPGIFPQILVATVREIFEVTPERSVIENRDVVAIGGGLPFAYGAIKALDRHTDDARALAMAGVRAAAAWDPDTSGPFHGWNITEQGKAEEFFSRS